MQNEIFIATFNVFPYKHCVKYFSSKSSATLWLLKSFNEADEKINLSLVLKNFNDNNEYTYSTVDSNKRSITIEGWIDEAKLEE